MIITDNVRSVNTRKLRKQFLDVKGKLFIYAEYVNPQTKKHAKILSNCASTNLGREIEIKRATYNAIATGCILSTVERHLGSGVKLKKILFWGVLYGNDTVKIKRYKVKGSYRVGIWVQGRRGMYKNYKYEKPKKDVLDKIAVDEGLTFQGVWSNE